ncbi:hypothetical protein M422DRAFT_48457 [Sphaerobolus stellatus SS14]|uniref:Uncharacterized protein n=1 Tax=Sphaerobolus stellatus (strain SS14) TaxID=990650 RepID=A0A0C9VK52_SPHS4|nr:hypothetical protein M422DRAFT_48457 [Sphaerobolus stellatus SS14]
MSSEAIAMMEFQARVLKTRRVEIPQHRAMSTGGIHPEPGMHTIVPSLPHWQPGPYSISYPQTPPTPSESPMHHEAFLPPHHLSTHNANIGRVSSIPPTHGLYTLDNSIWNTRLAILPQHSPQQPVRSSGHASFPNIPPECISRENSLFGAGVVPNLTKQTTIQEGTSQYRVETVASTHKADKVIPEVIEILESDDEVELVSGASKDAVVVDENEVTIVDKATSTKEADGDGNLDFHGLFGSSPVPAPASLPKFPELALPDGTSAFMPSLATSVSAAAVPQGVPQVTSKLDSTVNAVEKASTSAQQQQEDRECTGNMERETQGW